MDRSYLIDQADIDAVRGPLKDMLELELHKGNCICETWRGDWPYPSVTVIKLKHPFRAQLAENAPNVIYKEVNDPHYWKSEYYDTLNNAMLVCGFK